MMQNAVYTRKYKAPAINEKEVFRYAGIDKALDADITLFEGVLREAEALFTYGVCYCELPVKLDGDKVDIGAICVRSSSLAKNLFGCDKAIVFAASVGMTVDRLIARYSVVAPSRAVMLDAIATERIEALCDAFCEDISNEKRSHCEKLRPRFSAGYGDLPIELQRELFAILEPHKRIGLTLNNSFLMSPQKSVTAIVGIKNGVENENN